MPAATATRSKAPSQAKHRAILPSAARRGLLMPGEGDKTNALWPWYLMPFNMPVVSEQCEAYVKGEYEPEDEEEKAILRGELIAANTILASARDCIVQAPGGASPVRQDYYAKGFRLVTPTAGEASSGPALRMWPAQLEGGYHVGNHQTEQYIGIRDIVIDLRSRLPWALAQLDAKIEDASERAREDTGQNKRYMRAVVAALKQHRLRLANGIPTEKELQLFFLRFEQQRMESQQDQRLKEQQHLQGRIDDNTAAIVRLQSEINSESWGDVAEELPA